MFKIVDIKDRVRVSPDKLKKDIKEAVKEVLKESYEGLITREVGIILTIKGVGKVSGGSIIPEDGAVYYDTDFSALVFKPELQEVIEGEVIDIVEFGAFVQLGPLDGMVHVSQVIDDYVSFDEKKNQLAAKESKRLLKIGDQVRARIVSISHKKEGGIKIGLTMRQLGLGKIDWIEEDKKKAKKKK